MKSLNEYITEAKGNWSFSDYQRQSLGTAIGFMTGALGTKEDAEKYADFKMGARPLKKLRFTAATAVSRI